MTNTYPVKQLLAAAKTASKAVAGKKGKKKPSLLALHHLHVRTSGGRTTVTGSDLELWASMGFSTPELEDASFCLKPADLIGLLTSCGTSTIEIGSCEAGVKATAGKFSCLFNPETDEELPDAPSLADAALFGTDGNRLRDMLSQSRYALTKDWTRLVITGIGVKISPGSLTAYATDTHRMTKRTIAIQGGEEGAFILPRRLIDLAILHLGSSAVVVRQTGGFVQFVIAKPDGNTLALTARTIDGTFPDCEKIFKAHKPSFIAQIDRTELLAAAKRSTIVSYHPFRVDLKFVREGGEDTLNVATNFATGQTTETLPFKSLHPALADEEFNYPVNATYLIQLLSHVKGDTVTMRMQEPRVEKDAIFGYPCVVASNDHDFDLSVCMPLYTHK